jgi:hypothetical protein
MKLKKFLILLFIFSLSPIQASFNLAAIPVSDCALDNKAYVLTLGDGYSAPSSWMTLLANKTVQSEVGIGGMMQTEVENVISSFREDTGTLSMINDEMAVFQKSALNEKVLIDLMRLVTEMQKERIAQIQYQVMGASVLNRPDIQRKLALTDSQMKLMIEAGQQNKQEFEVLQKRLTSERLTQFGSYTVLWQQRDNSDKRLEKILTHEQFQQWELMKGRPVKWPTIISNQ